MRPASSETSSLRRFVAGLIAATGLLAVAACGDDGSSSETSDGKLRIEASFYPLQWMAEQVGGEHVEVTNLTKPGAEPHDLELTPKEVAAVQDAGMVVYLSGFQPAVDEAVENANGVTFDAADSADLDLTGDDGHDHGEEEGEHAEEDDHDHGDESVDPHFWLDPTRLADVAADFTDTLVDEDPDNADDYRANLEGLEQQLADLDDELRTGLADCESRELVTSHAAFGYFARRYDLHQEAISVSPEEEPSPSDLAEVSRFVEDHDVQTIYFETLVSPAVAETLASETGAETALLDPLEGLNDRSEGDDYVEVMQANLRSLQEGQPCPPG